ncbi:MAG TPA: recombinase family protein, partial [Nitrospirota bacterium]|nr:recombinase family protein [Nitrospirota bacterium]
PPSIEKLRFAPIIRVSTEKQKDKGESLRTQHTLIEYYVNALNGIIPEDCWKYCGQEHATPDQERRLLDSLLADTSKGIFDAVIVCDLSRWSRDSKKNLEGLDILKQNHIRFFVGMTEYDPYNPEHMVMLQMMAAQNQYQASSQTLKSIINRIHRAKRGIPTNGKLPYGRTFNKKTNEWNINDEAASKIQRAANEYLHGKSLVKIAKTLDMNASNLWKILTRRSGDTWSIRFKSTKLNIDETVAVTIPPLLSAETIDKILRRRDANKTYTHGQIKHRYLLSRMVFCAECGYAMFGQTNHGNRRYYRHFRYGKRPCDASIWVPAAELENSVVMNIFHTFGDKRAIEKSIEAAFPKAAETPALENKLAHFNKEQASVRDSINRIVKAIARGTITDVAADAEMAALNERASILSKEIDILRTKLGSLPSRKEISVQARRMHQLTRLRALDHWYRSPEYFAEMSYDSKRYLVEQAFSGKDVEGKRFGVYVKRATDDKAKWTYSVKGILSDQILGFLPISKQEEDYLLRRFNPETDLLPEDFATHETKYSLSLQNKLPSTMITVPAVNRKKEANDIRKLITCSMKT